MLLNINPTSPLGSGGLTWCIQFQPSSFQPFWFQPLWGRDLPLPNPSPGPWTPGAAGWWGLSLRLFCHLGALLFPIVLSMPFLIEFGSISPPHVGTQNPQNRSNIDAKMPSLIDLICFTISWSTFAPNFDPPLQLEHGFSKIAISIHKANLSKKPTKMRPKMNNFASILMPKALQRRYQFLPRFIN